MSLRVGVIRLANKMFKSCKGLIMKQLKNENKGNQCNQKV